MKRTGKRAIALLLALVMALSLSPAAFAGEEDGADEDTSTGLSVTLSESNLSLESGNKKDLTATVTKDGDPVKDGTVEIDWSADKEGKIVTVKKSSVNENIATVTAVAAGEATVTVTVTVTTEEEPEQKETAKAECKVTVTAPDVEKIAVSPTDVVLDKGETKKLSVTFTPSTASGEITWRSGDESVATVDDDGIVTGEKTGTTRIYARVGTLEASCQVSVRGIEFDNPPTTLKVGDTYTLKYNTYGLGEDPSISWSSKDPDIIRVATGGYCYALKEGKTTITAKVDGFSYEVSCEIEVKTNTASVITPGNIVPGKTLCFKDIKTELSDRCSTVLGEGLEYISGLSVSTKEGTLYYKYRSDDDTGRGIAPSDTFYLNPTASQDDLAEVYFLPQPGFSGTATISYTGYAGALSFFQGTIQINVEEVDHLTYTAAAGVPLQFRAEDFNNVCLNTTGRNLKNVVFTLPDSSRGTLYRNYISATSPGIAVREGDALQYTGTPNLSDVYFVPAVGYDGTVILSYTATDVNGQTFRSRVEINLTPAAGSGDINYTVSQGGTVSLSLDDFKALCKDFTSGTLDYVRFTLPEASQGTLYFDYTSASKPGTAVTASQNYYANGSPSLGKITFAASASGAGVAAIPFTGWDTRGNNFSGQVEIAIRISGAGDIRYTANSKGEAAFKASDFNDLCKELTGDTLNYVQFTLPASGQGTLYLNYTNSNSTKVTAGQKYYRSSTPSLDKITFVAASGFTGASSISFTGWSTGGASFTGTVEVQVDEVTSSSLTYTVRQGKSVTFGAGDFNSLCREETGQDLRYVRFTLPSASQGTLYYDYTNTSSQKVTEKQSYYRTSSPYLDRVTFVPAAYLGTVTVAFDGWSTGGKTFSGAVKITVEENPDAIITYNSAYAPVRFQAADFLKACQAQGVSDVTSVTFTPPGSTWGRLYYQYTAPLKYSSEVRASTSYYLTGSPSLSDITFVPKAGRQGTVTIPYVATGSSGKTCAGTVRIVLQPSTYSQHFTDMGNYSWAAPAVDYLYENNITTGTGSGRYQPASAMSRGDFMVMVVRAFGLTSSGTASFPDVPQDAYYASAVATAKVLGIATGYEDGTFKPGNTLSRQEAMVFLQRAFQAAGWYIGDGSQSTLALYPDGSQVAGYAQGAMAAMVEWGILYGKDGLLDPWGALTRAEMAVLLYRALTL